MLLAFALLVQNTCPHGFAGKTTVVKGCGSCKVAQLHHPAPQSSNSISVSPSPVHHPLFVFSVPKTIHTFRLDRIAAARPLLADRYTDALPGELLRPPQA